MARKDAEAAPGTRNRLVAFAARYWGSALWAVLILAVGYLFISNLGDPCGDAESRVEAYDIVLGIPDPSGDLSDSDWLSIYEDVKARYPALVNQRELAVDSLIFCRDEEF